MQHSIVTFVDPDNNVKITINFEYDLEKKVLNYEPVIEPELEQGKDYGLNLYLANMFLTTLQPKTEEIDDTEENTNGD